MHGLICNSKKEGLIPRKAKHSASWRRLCQRLYTCSDVLYECRRLTLLKADDEPFRLIVAFGRTAEPDAMATNDYQVSNRNGHGMSKASERVLALCGGQTGNGRMSGVDHVIFCNFERAEGMQARRFMS